MFGNIGVRAVSSHQRGASEISGDLGSNSKTIKRKDYDDINNTYKENNSNRTIGKHNKTKDTNGKPISGYHDHEIGHTFDRTPHFNAWSESTGTSFKNNVHLYYE